MPLATFLAQHLLFANIGGLLWKRLATDVLGDDVALPVAPGPDRLAAATRGRRAASGPRAGCR